MTTDINYISNTLINKFKYLGNLIGNTPMIKIRYEYKGKKGFIFAKCEQYNFTGSIKDRMALYILYKAYSQGYINPKDTIVEATSGNTGIAFAAIGKVLGHNVKIIMPDWLSKERKDLIRSMGAEVILVSKEEGGFIGSINKSEELHAKGGVFLPKQFENTYNVKAHVTSTMPEVWKQLKLQGLQPNAVIAGVGTGGTVMGACNYFKRKDKTIGVYPLEPKNSPTLSTGYKVGSHRIQGISDEFIPSIVKLSKLDQIICTDDGDAIIMAQKLAYELGIGVGISSGANVLGAIQKKEELGSDATVVTFLNDSNKKYLSTDLMKNEPIKEGFISSNVRLLDFETISRCSINKRMHY